MKKIYTATKDVKITLKITNQVEVESIVYLNSIEYDNVILSEGKDNTRVLEIDLKQGDTIEVKENELLNYSYIHLNK